jgi:hypothetical protein
MYAHETQSSAGCGLGNCGTNGSAPETWQEYHYLDQLTVCPRYDLAVPVHILQVSFGR